jgi:hypothetical protein
MSVLSSHNPFRGMSLIDTLVGSALTLVIFLALFGLVRASILIVTSAKAKAGATAVATAQMEYIRSIPYVSLGTIGGIPAGSIPQNATTTLNAISYGVRTFIVYVDDPADGIGGADANGITADYKRIKVSVSYIVQNRYRTVDLVSDYSPFGVETTAGGGTLRLEAVNAVGAPVSGATVRVVNASTSPTIDVSTFSDITGTVLFSGAPTSTEYQIYVSKSGYSSAQTYPRDGTNQNPTPGYLTVAQTQTTTGTFAIDFLGTLTIRTFSPPTPGTFTDLFSDVSLLAVQTNTQVSGGALILSGTPGFYVGSGNARSTTTTPANLSSWNQVTANLSTPGSTAAVVQIVDASGLLVPDSALAGNSAGFSTFPVNISSLSTTTYPTLALRANLSSSDVNVTPSVLDWELSYEVGKTALPNVPFSLTGAKTIGSTIVGNPLYKTQLATTSGASGVKALSLEWDLYTLSLTGYTIVSETIPSPYQLLPGTSVDVELILSP